MRAFLLWTLALAVVFGAATVAAEPSSDGPIGGGGSGPDACVTVGPGASSDVNLAYCYETIQAYADMAESAACERVWAC